MKTEEPNHSDSLDEEWVDSPFSDGAYAQDENPMLGEMPNHPLHVKVVDTQTQTTAPEFTAWSSFPIGLLGTNPPTQLCPHKYHRNKAKFTVSWGTSMFSVTTPIVAGTVTHAAVPAGAQISQIIVNLSGGDALALTLTAGTGNNTFTGLIPPGGTAYAATTYDVSGTPLAINNSGAPANVVLSASQSVTGYLTVFYSVTPILYIANKPNPLTSGALQNVWQISPGTPFPDYDGQQEVWAIASVAGIEVNVVDETYGTVQ